MIVISDKIPKNHPNLKISLKLTNKPLGVARCVETKIQLSANTR